MQTTHLKPMQQATKNRDKIKLTILAPLFAAILLLLWTFTLAVYHLQQRHITNEVRMRLDSTRGFFNEQLATDARLLGAIIDFLSNDPNLQNIWLARDRNDLLNYTAPLFEKFHRNYGITHLYFIDADKTCFLRVHSPARFGDHIDRFTLRAAGLSMKPYWGIELGPFGTFTLRQVHPWYVNNTFVGFIELGKEIEHIAPQLKKGLDVELVFLINKSFLNRQSWEQGQKIMGRSANWDLIPDCAIAGSTIPSLPPEFIKFAGLPHNQHEGSFVSATFNGSTYRAGCVPLLDAAGHTVGDILVIKNTTKDEASLHSLLAVVTTICLGVGALLVVLFYVHIARIEKRLLNARASLETEIEKRKVVESELRRHRDNLEEIVDSRTAEIETTNKHLHEEITERKKTEEALRKSEERFKQVAQIAGDWIWEVNAEGLYTYSSPVAETLLGYKTEEIVGKKYFYDFFSPETREQLKKSAFDVFDRKESFTGFVNSVIHKNGSVIIFETTGTPVLDDKGNLLGYRGADRDITERKKAEKAMEKLNADLETTVAQLSRSNRQLRDFAYLAAHDLKTPLRGIGMLAQWLSEDYRGKFDDAGQRQIDLLVKRVERMDKLIDAVLVYSTIARNKQNERKVDLNLLLNVVLADIKPPQNIKINVNNDLPTIICDEKQIAQVFYNLLSNAVNFMNKSEGLINVDCNEEGDFLQFSVSDNGPGIEPQHFDRIFRLFQTLNDRDQYETTGAGLALAKKIVELYDGRIWLTSTVGVGSTFFFTLPKQMAAVAPQTLQTVAI
jgi:PAS domain S-box-containing protein